MHREVSEQVQVSSVVSKYIRKGGGESELSILRKPLNSAYLTASHISQVERLARHASVVVWGGSNENEFALTW